jgi:hypothetical protein
MSFTGDTAHVERRPTWGRSLADNDTQEGVDMAVGERELDRLSKFPTSDSVARAPGEDEKQLFETSVDAGDLEREPNIPLPLEEAMLEARRKGELVGDGGKLVREFPFLDYLYFQSLVTDLFSRLL